MSKKGRGVTIRLFGAILIMLGSLDMMLTWRGAMHIEPFHAALFLGGIVLFGLGAIKGSYGDRQ